MPFVAVPSESTIEEFRKRYIKPRLKETCPDHESIYYWQASGYMRAMGDTHGATYFCALSHVWDDEVGHLTWGVATNV